MTAEKKEFKGELIVKNVRSEDDRVILDLRFAKPRFEETSKKQLEKIVQPVFKTKAEQFGRDYAKGVMDVMTKQVQQQTQQLSQFLPPIPPPDTIKITLSKQEYAEIGRPTVDDKLILKLKKKSE